MKYLYLILLLADAFVTGASCNWAKQKAKDTVNKTGEVVAKTGSEFVNGVSKGVEKTFQNEVVFSDRLKDQGLKTGKIVIRHADTPTDMAGSLSTSGEIRDLPDSPISFLIKGRISMGGGS